MLWGDSRRRLRRSAPLAGYGRDMETPKIKELNEEIIYVEVPNHYIPVRVRDIVVLLARCYNVGEYKSSYHEVALKTGVFLSGRCYSLPEESSILEQERDLLRYDEPIWEDFETVSLEGYGIRELQKINLGMIISMDMYSGIVRFKEPPDKFSGWPGIIELKHEQDKWRIYEHWELLFRQKGFQVLTDTGKHNDKCVFYLEKDAVESIDVR